MPETQIPDHPQRLAPGRLDLVGLIASVNERLADMEDPDQSLSGIGWRGRLHAFTTIAKTLAAEGIGCEFLCYYTNAANGSGTEKRFRFAIRMDGTLYLPNGQTPTMDTLYENLLDPGADLLDKRQDVWQRDDGAICRVECFTGNPAHQMAQSVAINVPKHIERAGVVQGMVQEAIALAQQITLNESTPFPNRQTPRARL